MKIKTDVLICGGGCAGLAAALAAARSGAQTIMVERAPFAGGIITCVGLAFFDGIADYYTHRVVTPGIAVELLAACGACAPDTKKLDGDHHITIDNIERFKIVADELIKAESPRLQVLYHTSVCDVKTKSGEIDTVYVANKDGLVGIKPRIVIDCTGDGDVAAWAGAPVTKMNPSMPMTMHFRVGKVDASHNIKTIHAMMKEQCLAAQAAGELPHFYGPSACYQFGPDELAFHAVRVPGDGSDAADLTRAEMQGRKDAWTMFRWFKKNIPAFRDSYVISTGPYIGIRETRRIDGEYVLNEQDIRDGRRFDDAVATGSWYLDRHPNKTTLGRADEEPGFQPHPYDISNARCNRAR